MLNAITYTITKSAINIEREKNKAHFFQDMGRNLYNKSQGVAMYCSASKKLGKTIPVNAIMNTKIKLVKS